VADQRALPTVRIRILSFQLPCDGLRIRKRNAVFQSRNIHQFMAAPPQVATIRRRRIIVVQNGIARCKLKAIRHHPDNRVRCAAQRNALPNDSVGQRTREIVVRMALGAQREMVERIVLKEGGRLAALGIVVGPVCSLAATLLLRSVLFGVQTWDLGTLGGVALLLAAAALLASYIPARRAASINPVEALRAEQAFFF
jgi:hypothetical protein